MDPDGTFPSDGRSVVHQSAVREFWDNDDTRQLTLLPDGSGFLMLRRMWSTADSTVSRLILREQIVPPK
jgi:hypothetical protein